ncbi:RrF2 family transcriptional regulator [Rhizobium alvei]|uniref:Rrf2 family transcriptional regulator n=1 Tax=Rhizobium alvei TaxID=1132659 RepID=A0ABT8YGU6_9HYPH|nr:Rrf2 family transcriptional regulator [Rhizobium alvei]MDO6962900.1 Rrf2 family transcriptional regulator [Rhizobium alvei]
MRITTRTNLAIRTLMFCAVNPDRMVRKVDIAEACNASENHLAQVIRTLAHKGVIDASRGRTGGLQLAHEPEKINIGTVFRAFEQDLPFAECMSRNNTCPLVSACWLRPAIQKAVEAFYTSLDAVFLSDLVVGNDNLSHILTMSDRPMAGCSRSRA